MMPNFSASKRVIWRYFTAFIVSNFIHFMSLKFYEVNRIKREQEKHDKSKRQNFISRN